MINFWKSKLKLKLKAKDFEGTNFEDSFDDALVRNLKKHFNVFNVHVKTKTLVITSLFGSYRYIIEGGLDKDRYESIRRKVKLGIFVLNLTKI